MAIRRHPVVVVLAALVFGLLGAWFATNQPDAFSSQAGIVVEDARSSTLFNGRSSDADRYVADQVAILQSRVVYERASQLAASGDPAFDISVEDFLANTTITSSQDSNFIRISFIASTAQKAQAGAGAIGLAYEAAIQEALAEDAERAVAELDKAIGTAVQEIEALQSQIEALRTDNDERVELDNQLAEIVGGLVELRKASATLDAEGVEVPPGLGGTVGAPTAEDLRRAAEADILVRIQQLTEELSGRLLVSDVEAQVPATAFLLQQQADAAARLSELTLRSSQIEVDSRLAGNGVAFLAPAGPGVERGVPTSSAIVLMAAIGALFGAGVAYWLAQRRRDYVVNRLTPHDILEVPLLAEVPRLSRGKDLSNADEIVAEGRVSLEEASMLPILYDPASTQAESFRILVGSLTKRLDTMAAESGKRRGMTIAVSSATIGEGPTIVAVNTALAASLAGLNVAVVDGDFGAQDASRLLTRIQGEATTDGDSGHLGLTDVAQSGASLNDVIVEIDTNSDGFVALIGRGRGTMTAPDFFSSRTARRVLSQLERQFDLVILDLPPLLQVAYATAAVQKADHALAVVCHASPVTNLDELRYRLDVIGVSPIGYVYTNAPLRRSVVPRRGPSFDVLGHGSLE